MSVPLQSCLCSHFDPTLSFLSLNRLRQRMTWKPWCPSLCHNAYKGLSPSGMGAAACSWVPAAFLPHLSLRLWPCTSPKVREEAACHARLLHVSQAFLCLLWHAGLPACSLLLAVHRWQPQRCCRTLSWWGRGLGLFQHPSLLQYHHQVGECTCVDIFGLGSYCLLHFVNLFRRNRLTRVACVCQMSWFVIGS